MDANSVPLLALSIEAQTMLSTLLNPLKIIPSDTNLPRDWRGLADLTNVPAEKIALIEGKPDPVKELLTFLTGSVSRGFGVDDFKALLGVIDRFDVLEDVEAVLERDKVAYTTKISQIQVDRNAENLDASQDSNILTYEDAYRAQNGLSLCRYDAFILFSDDDASFASEIISRMENDYQLKLCSKDRDLLPGHRFEHEVIGKMIEARCNRLLVIFSPNFLESNANQFLVSYAQAVALDTRSRKIIPCVYKKCELPPSVRYSFCIDYNRSGKLWNFWDKLSQSLSVARDVSTTSTSSAATSIQTEELKDHGDQLWWDANKPSKLSDPEYSRNTEDQGNDYPSFDKNMDERSDTVSMHSQAQLLPTANSSSSKKPSKWFSKIISRKKRSDKDKTKPAPIAE